MTKARTTTATTVPGISKPPADISPALRRYLESISEALEIRLGRRGDARDRAVTFRELLDSGLAIELGSNPYQIGKPPADPDPDPPANGTPTAPTNFSANGGYSIVTCFWDYPNYGPHSHTEIWRHTANVIGDAQLVGISSGISFIDPVGQSKTYYYWARHVSTYDIAGPFHSANGDEATTAANVTELLNVLTGAITESQLYQTLGARINLIDAAATEANSVNARILTETNARVAAINAEATARTTAISAEAATRAQAIADEAAARGTAISNEATLRTNADNALAQQITTLSATAAGTYATIAALQTEQTARADGDTAQATARETLAAQLRGTYNGTDVTQLSSGLVFSERQARVTADSALSSRSDALEATVNNPTTGLVATRATLVNDYYTKAATDSAISAASTTLTSQINTKNRTYAQASAPTGSLIEGDLWYDTDDSNKTYRYQGGQWVASDDTRISGTIANLSSNYYTKAATDSAIAASSLTLQTQINQKNRSYRQASAPGATGLIDGDIWFDSDDNNKAYRWNGSSWVATDDARIASTQADLQTNYYTKSSTDSAIAAATLNLVSNTALTNTLASYATNATLTNNYYTKTATDSAISGATTGLVSTTTLNNTLASYATNATLTTNYYTKTATDNAISVATQNLVSTTALNNTLGSYVTSSYLTTNYYTKTSTDTAISNATVNLVSTTTLNNSLGNYTTTAALQQNYYTKASGETLEGRYTVKVDLNGYVAGFGLAATANTGTPTSEFIIRADRFSIAAPGQTAIIPFIVQASATTLNGVAVPAGVYMDAAFIKNGTITSVKIGNGEIDDAKIANLNAAKITAGSIDTARLTIDNVTLDSYYDASVGRNRLRIRDLGVDTAQINNAAIKTAKIDDLAVSTLKIAGNAITQPEVYTAPDVYIPNNSSAAIQMTSSGVSEVYNYVGANNGDYIYVQYYNPYTGEFLEYYSFVGTGNGDYTRTVVYGPPTFINAITVLETPVITVGVDATAAVQIVYYGTHDGSIYTYNDSGQHLFMLLDTGSGYRLAAQQQVGLRTDSSADTMASLPIAMTFTARNITTARVKILTGSRRVDLAMGNFSNACWLRNNTISLLGAKR